MTDTSILSPRPAERLLFLDQLRGYTIFGMILVNFLGGFRVMPGILKHHSDWMSYADTIAPLFLFVVGLGFRFSFQRKAEKAGLAAARWSSLKRYSLLIAVGIVLYGPHPKNWSGNWWDALVDIGFAGILALPFIEKSALVRALAAAGYMALYQAIFSWTGYGEWTVAESIDGGPLGIFAWVVPLLVGTLAWDWVEKGDSSRLFKNSILWGVGLGLLGIALHLPWGEVKDRWVFSQSAMSSPYTLLSTGLCFVPFLFFYWLCHLKGKALPHLTRLGKNPLVLYIFHILLLEAHGSIAGRGAPGWQALVAFAFFYGCCYAVAAWLDRQKIILKL
jgi:predicted acyltransferase